MKMRITRFETLTVRRLSTRGKNGVASVIAIAGVCCAVMVMLLTLSITLGFKKAIREKLSGFNADVVIQPAYDYENGIQLPFLELTDELKSVVDENIPSNIKRSTVTRLPGVLKTPTDFATLIFTGYGSGHNDEFERNNIVDGVWPDYNTDATVGQIVISRATADKLSLKVGDKCPGYFFIDERIRANNFTIAGIYSSDFGEFDNTVCYASQKQLQHICKVDSTTITWYELRGFHDEDITQAANQLQAALITNAQVNNLGYVPVVDNSMRSGAVYINWLKLLDTNVVVIFVLMCAVAAFTLISSLFILILNNIPFIGLLRSIGASKNTTQRIFVLLAMKLVGAGLVIGNIITIVLIYIQLRWRILPLNPEMYYLSYVPMDWNITGFILIDIGVIVMAFLTLILPSRIVGTISPARTMRYE